MKQGGYNNNNTNALHGMHKEESKNLAMAGSGIINNNTFNNPSKYY